MSAHDPLSEFTQTRFVHEPEAFRRIREETPKRGLPAINVQPDDGWLLHLLARSCGARLALEVGTLGGYSACWIASALPADGKLISLEREPAHAEVAREHIAAAGFADRVEVRVGDAHQIMGDWQEAPLFDFVFIDAEKTGYPDYLSWATAHTRPGAWITAHNALYGGRILVPPTDDDSAGTRAIREYHRMVDEDPRLAGTLFPGGDGTAMALRIDA